MLIRAEFKKLKPVRYISHLELMDTFRRSFRRARLPAAYSQGYNPHIKLALGQPLPVGMVGFSEYLDLELCAQIPASEAVNRINNNLPQGIRLSEAHYIPDDAKSLQAAVNTAVYLFVMKFSGPVQPEQILQNFMARNKIEITRHRRNKKDRRLDLRPLLYEAEAEAEKLWRFTVSTGSSGNVRPSEVVRALSEQEENLEPIPVVNIIREGMFVRKDEELHKPFSEIIVND